MTLSSFESCQGVVIWHSRSPVNRTRVTAAHRQIKTRYVGAMASDEARTRKLSSAPVNSAAAPCHQRTRPVFLS